MGISDVASGRPQVSVEDRGVQGLPSCTDSTPFPRLLRRHSAALPPVMVLPPPPEASPDQPLCFLLGCALWVTAPLVLAHLRGDALDAFEWSHAPPSPVDPASAHTGTDAHREKPWTEQPQPGGFWETKQTPGEALGQTDIGQQVGGRQREGCVSVQSGSPSLDG